MFTITHVSRSTTVWKHWEYNTWHTCIVLVLNAVQKSDTFVLIVCSASYRLVNRFSVAY